MHGIFRINQLVMFSRDVQCLLKVLGTPIQFQEFLPPSYSRGINDNVRPLPPSYIIESVARALSYLERHHFIQARSLYALQTILFYGGGDFVVRL